MSNAAVEMTPEMTALKSKLKATWEAGDFGQIARLYERDAADFVARLNLQPGTRILDVACGTDNLALPSARAGAVVTGIDIAPNLIEQARANAAAENLEIQFDEGDAENLSYPDASFEAVVSMFGVMFAPRPELIAAELIRVCRPEGLIAMANWTPTSLVGQMFKAVARHVPPPPAMPSPLLWGDEDTVRGRLGDGIKELNLTRQFVTFISPLPPAEVVELFKIYYGPTQKAFGILDADGQTALRGELEQLWDKNNRATDGTTAVQSEYLEVRAVRA